MKNYKIVLFEDGRTSTLKEILLPDLPGLDHNVEIVFDGMINKYKVIEVIHKEGYDATIIVEQIY